MQIRLILLEMHDSFSFMVCSALGYVKANRGWDILGYVRVTLGYI